MNKYRNALEPVHLGHLCKINRCLWEQRRRIADRKAADFDSLKLAAKRAVDAFRDGILIDEEEDVGEVLGLLEELGHVDGDRNSCAYAATLRPLSVMYEREPAMFALSAGPMTSATQHQKAAPGGSLSVNEDRDVFLRLRRADCTTDSLRDEWELGLQVDADNVLNYRLDFGGGLVSCKPLWVGDATGHMCDDCPHLRERLLQRAGQVCIIRVPTMYDNVDGNGGKIIDRSTRRLCRIGVSPAYMAHKGRIKCKRENAFRQTVLRVGRFAFLRLERTYQKVVEKAKFDDAGNKIKPAVMAHEKHTHFVKPSFTADFGDGQHGELCCVILHLGPLIAPPVRHYTAYEKRKGRWWYSRRDQSPNSAARNGYIFLYDAPAVHLNSKGAALAGTCPFASHASNGRHDLRPSATLAGDCGARPRGHTDWRSSEGEHGVGTCDFDDPPVPNAHFTHCQTGVTMTGDRASVRHGGDREKEGWYVVAYCAGAVVVKGRTWWEVLVEGDRCQGRASTACVGVCDPSADQEDWRGGFYLDDTGSLLCEGNGFEHNDGDPDGRLSPGDRVGVLLDVDAEKKTATVHWSKNGVIIPQYVTGIKVSENGLCLAVQLYGASQTARVVSHRGDDAPSSVKAAVDSKRVATKKEAVPPGTEDDDLPDWIDSDENDEEEDPGSSDVDGDSGDAGWAGPMLQDHC
eukprot:gene17695-37225_t